MAARIRPKRPVHLYLAEWREYRGLTQEQLGLRLDPPVSGVTIGRWEAQKRGEHRPNDETLAALAEALDCHPSDFYRPPESPSADDLLRDQSPEVVENAIRVIKALRRSA